MARCCCCSEPMAELQQALIAFFHNSPLREYSVSMLRSVPGLPPILQTIHLLGVAIIMGSAVMLSLRILGIACRRQQLQEMAGRLFPWFLCALPVMLLSALPFFCTPPTIPDKSHIRTQVCFFASGIGCKNPALLLVQGEKNAARRYCQAGCSVISISMDHDSNGRALDHLR